MINREPKPGLAILDCDGVLNTGSTEVYVEHIGESLQEIGIKAPSTGEILGQWGSPPEKIMVSYIRDNPAALKKALDHYRRLQREDFPKRIQPVDGTVEALEELSDNNNLLALNTAADREVLMEGVLPRLGIDPDIFTGGIIAADDIPNERFYKPDPFAINKLVRDNRLMGVSRERTVMVGDSGSDVISAWLADVEAIVTLTGNLSLEDALELYEVPRGRIIESVASLPIVAEHYFRSMGKTALNLRPA